jgi:DNA invertase Pin-like site-specific DNA recombinase
MNNNLLNEYISIRAAARKTSISRSTISLHLKDNTKIDGRKFIWKYA